MIQKPEGIGAASSGRPDTADAVLAAVRRATRQAIIEHQQSGDPIVVWEDGQVRWIPADEIVIPDLPDSD